MLNPDPHRQAILSGTRDQNLHCGSACRPRQRPLQLLKSDPNEHPVVIAAKIQAVQTRALADQASASSYRAEFGMLMIAAAIFMIAAVLYLGLTPLSGRPSNVVIEAVLTLAKTKPWLAFSIVMGRSILFTVGIYSACTVIGQVWLSTVT